MDDNEAAFINHACVDHLPESDIERKREPYTESSYNNGDSITIMRLGRKS